MKKKYLRANHATFMTKEVRKAIMMRSKLRNKFLQDKNEQSRNDYRKLRNLCIALVCRAKQQHFSSLDLSLIADNKKYWKTVKPLFSDKISHKDIISSTSPQNQHVPALKTQFLQQSINSEIIPASSLLIKTSRE